MATTAKEALLAELLGDVGRLADQVDGLPGAIKEAVAPTLCALTIAASDIREAIELSGKSEQAALAAFAVKEKVALHESLRRAIQEEAANVFKEAGLALEVAARRQEETAKIELRQRWYWLLVAFLAGAFGASLAVWVNQYAPARAIEDQAALGRAVLASWSHLDTKTKEQLQAVMHRAP